MKQMADTTPRWRLGITWGIAIVCSGLGGAVLNTWYANRSTIIEYTITRTALGADQTAVIPDFRVGATSLQSLYIYSVKLQYRSGPEIESAKVGIGLLTPNVKLIGKTVPEGPSQVFHISCDPFGSQSKSSGTTCSVGRFSPHVGVYSVSFATDTDARIDVSVDAKNAQVRQAGAVGVETPDRGLPILSAALFVLLAAVAGYYFGRQGPVHSVAELSEAINIAAGRTKLSVDYEGNEGNRVDARYKKGETDVDEIYIRVRVRNLGHYAAKGSRVFLTSLHEVHGAVTTPAPLYDSLQMAWAGWNFEPRDIPQGVTFYADLMRVSKRTPGWLFSVREKLANHAALPAYSGTYRFQVTVTADNADPAVCEVDVTYNQDWHTLRAGAARKAQGSPA
jgi:hypothetical protein